MKHYLSGEGLADGSVEVIPNWSDRETVYPVPSDQNQLRQSWGLAKRFVVGHSGNLGRVHDTETIKQAIRQLEGDVSLVFLFVGGGKGYEDLREWATERNFANVQFHPYQPKDRLHLSLSLPDVHLISLAPSRSRTYT
jgi:glycosyltransferase involved in cell wall biosynthesis